MIGGAFNQLNDLVLDLSVTDSQVFAAVDGGMNSAAAWDLGGGARQWRAQANGDVQAVQYDNGNVYFGFHDGFTIDGVRDFTLRVLAADAQSGTIESFRPVSGGAVGVWGIDSDGQYLAVVGKFPKMGGFNVKGISIHPRRRPGRSPVRSLIVRSDMVTGGPRSVGAGATPRFNSCPVSPGIATSANGSSMGLSPIRRAKEIDTRGAGV